MNPEPITDVFAMNETVSIAGDEFTSEILKASEEVPLLPLKDTVIFPNTIVPLYVGREKSLKAIERAAADDKVLLLVTQREQMDDEPVPGELYDIGTRANIVQLLKMPDGTAKLLVEGTSRVRVIEVKDNGQHLTAAFENIEDMDNEPSLELEALQRSVLQLFERVVNLHKNLPNEAYVAALNIKEPERLGDMIATHLSLPVEEQQELLEELSLRLRLRRLCLLLEKELEILELENRIQSEVRAQLEKLQREMYLREQIKVIQRELNGDEDGEQGELERLAAQVESTELPEEVRAKIQRELDRLKRMPPISPEAPMLRNYIDWMLDLPWGKPINKKITLAKAERILEKSHYGLAKAKERILEYLAVYKLTGNLRGPILCFVGPPGTGKTSIGKSIAESLGREFVRISLGGMKDEAEIRGHRRTYIGAMPGRIIQAMRQAGTRNPVFMMDEIDKIGMDFRGDPASALLEVLDPEQNNSFSDNYIEVPYDLSEVMFVTTANTLETVPPALKDRMEIILFNSYTDEEKLRVAREFLIPRQITANGLKPSNIEISDGALLKIIREYARESGVRNLEREIGALCRKSARKIADGGRRRKIRITTGSIPTYLGQPAYSLTAPEGDDLVGVANGLAWTEVGGETLNIEASVIAGKGNVLLTGQLGDVMRESAQAALTYVRSRADELKLEYDLGEESDIHIHVPAGAVPKDGPSAGVTLATAIASAATGIPVRGDLAMTGEVTLRGRVLQVAGIKEKVLAAYRDGLTAIVLPAENVGDLEEIPASIRRKISFIPVRHMDDVLKAALVKGEGRKRKAMVAPTLPGKQAAKAVGNNGSMIEGNIKTDAGTVHESPL